MARILSNLILMRHSYPPVVIRQAKRDEYLYALRQADEGEYESLVAFMGTELIHSMDLCKRAAEGEDISSLGDFDKRLALLKQRIESLEKETPRAKDIFSQVSLSNILIEPLLMKLHPRYQEIDRAFQTVESSVESSFEARGPDEFRDKARSAHLSAINLILSEYDVTELKILETWKGFKLNVEKTLSCQITVRLAPYEFEISHFISGTHVGPVQILRETYDAIFMPEQIDGYASVILRGLYDALAWIIHTRKREFMRFAR